MSGGFSDDEDMEDMDFMNYEEKRTHKERESIQPLNMGLNMGNMGNGGNSSNSAGMGGSVMDRASNKDMLRVDANPIAIDPSIGFDSVGGLDKHVS